MNQVLSIRAYQLHTIRFKVTATEESNRFINYTLPTLIFLWTASNSETEKYTDCDLYINCTKERIRGERDTSPPQQFKHGEIPLKRLRGDVGKSRQWGARRSHAPPPLPRASRGLCYLIQHRYEKDCL